jgi:hypothetical protein
MAVSRLSQDAMLLGRWVKGILHDTATSTFHTEDGGSYIPLEL